MKESRCKRIYLFDDSDSKNSKMEMPFECQNEQSAKFPFRTQDVYENHKDEFLDAFLEYEENSSIGHGYFDTMKSLIF